jgi:hypothetical protein
MLIQRARSGDRSRRATSLRPVDTFSRLSRQDDTSALVGKKDISEDSELVSYFLFDDKEIVDCLVNLSCLNSRKKRKQLKTRTLVTQYNKKPC